MKNEGKSKTFFKTLEPQHVQMYIWLLFYTNLKLHGSKKVFHFWFSLFYKLFLKIIELYLIIIHFFKCTQLFFYTFFFQSEFLRNLTTVKKKELGVINFCYFCLNFSEGKLNIHSLYNEDRFGPAGKDKEPFLE